MKIFKDVVPGENDAVIMLKHSFRNSDGRIVNPKISKVDAEFTNDPAPAKKKTAAAQKSKPVEKKDDSDDPVFKEEPYDMQYPGFIGYTADCGAYAKLGIENRSKLIGNFQVFLTGLLYNGKPSGIVSVRPGEKKCIEVTKVPGFKEDFDYGFKKL